MAKCIDCGCSNHEPCVDSATGEYCTWVRLSPDESEGLCSFCLPEDVDDEDGELFAPSRELILPGDPEFHL